MSDMWESTVQHADAAFETSHQQHHLQLTKGDVQRLTEAVDANTATIAQWVTNDKQQAPRLSAVTERLSKTTVKECKPKLIREVHRDRKEAPLVKLSSGLLNTYLNINEKYYASLKKKATVKESVDVAHAVANEKGVSYQYKASSDSSIYDDKNCDYIIRVGEIWDDRYEVIRVLGRGSFGQVVEAYDAVNKEQVAIKIIKNKQAFYNQALLEIRILQYLNAQDKKDQNHIVRMKRHFVWRNHLCISYELLSMNLYELLRNQNFAGVSLNLVRKFAIQILTALRFLSRSDISVIHCDLKPENIVLKNSKRSALKLIDFGSSCFSNQKTYSYIQSRFYRSPEVLLGVPYQTSIDMWSLGCLLVEMHTGQPLFDGLTEHEQICKLEDVLGAAPTDMFNRACLKKRNVMYKQHSNGAYSLLPCKAFIPKNKSLEGVVKDKMYSIAAATSGSSATVPTHVEEEYDLFLDLIRRMLQYRPEDRIRPEAAMEHPWLNQSAESFASPESAHSLPYQAAPQHAQPLSANTAQQQPLMKRVEKFTTGLSWSRKR